MGLWDAFKDSLKAGVRNPGDVGGTLDDFRDRQATRKESEQLLGRTATLGAELEQQRQAALTWYAQQLAAGQNLKVETIVRAGTILDGYSAIIRFHMGGEEGRVDVFYGGIGTPLGQNHGHIVVRKGTVISWLAHGASGADRNRII